MKKIFSIFAVVVLLFAANEATAQKKISKMGVGVTPGVTIPLGDWTDWVNTGFSVLAHFHYHIGPQFTIVGTAGYQKWGTDVDEDLEGYGDLEASNIPIMVGAGYRIGDRDQHFIIGGQIGLNMLKATASVDLGLFGGVSESDTETEFGFSPFGQAFFRIGDNMLFMVDARFNIISDANNFGLNAGIMFEI